MSAENAGGFDSRAARSNNNQREAVAGDVVSNTLSHIPGSTGRSSAVPPQAEMLGGGGELTAWSFAERNEVDTLTAGKGFADDDALGASPGKAFPMTAAAAFLEPLEVQNRLCGADGGDCSTVVADDTRWLRQRWGKEYPACRETWIPRADVSSPTDDVERASGGGAGDVGVGYGCIDSEGETSDDWSDGGSDQRSGDTTESVASTLRISEAGFEATLDSEQAMRLLVLMYHARQCLGHHRSPRLAEVCRSVKSMMLHLRSCSGRTSTGEPCPVPWCRPCATVMRRLVRCPVGCTDLVGCQDCFHDLTPD